MLTKEFAASAHRGSVAHGALKPHPARQDADCAQEMTVIDCSPVTEGEAVGGGGSGRVKTRQYAQWVLVCEVRAMPMGMCAFPLMGVHTGSVHPIALLLY